MNRPWVHIAKARTLLKQARYLLAGGFTDGAGRDAYIAGLHVALALIVQRTGREPKTHSGARSEFARLLTGEPSIDRAYVTFLGRGFALKLAADYDDGESLGHTEVDEIVGQAERMLETVAAALPLEET